jgi:hypothetical protein
MAQHSQCGPLVAIIDAGFETHDQYVAGNYGDTTIAAAYAVGARRERTNASVGPVVGYRLVHDTVGVDGVPVPTNPKLVEAFAASAPV